MALSRRYVTGVDSFKFDGPLQGTSFDPNDPAFQSLMTGINSEAAIALRGKFLAHNEALKQKMGASGKEIPLVLIPRHELKIYRHIKNYDAQTGYLKHNESFGLAKQAQALRDAASLTDQAVAAINSWLGTDMNAQASKQADNVINTAIAKAAKEGAVDYFEITPKDGMNDFLGIKFEYTYDKEITNFTLSFNNERGKNRNRFMSGDVVEFYFDLVDEETIVKLEEKRFAVKKEDIKIPLPLVFTGVLEEFSCNESADSLTIDWSGRNGAYILAEASINYNYPLVTETLCTSYNTMSYEEIIWNMIVYSTGMVVGEVDLGNRNQFYYLGSIGDDALNRTGQSKDNVRQAEPDKAQRLDLMTIRTKGNESATNGNAQTSNFTRFKLGLCEILSAHDFCTTNEKDEHNRRKIRWSALLEFDLLKPKVFSMAEIEYGAGSQQSDGGQQGVAFAPGVLGSYIYGSEGEPGSSSISGAGALGNINTVPPNIRFKTKFARDIFAYQYNIIQTNYKTVLNAAPIKTQVLSKNGETVKAILITRDMYFRSFQQRAVQTSSRDPKEALKGLVHPSMSMILQAIYRDITTDIGTAKRALTTDQSTDGYNAWVQRVIELYTTHAASDPASNFVITESNFQPKGDVKELSSQEKQKSSINAYGGLNYNRDASLMPLVIQNPQAPPDIGSMLIVPYPSLDKYGIIYADFYPMTLATNIQEIDPEENCALEPILKVRSVFPQRNASSEGDTPVDWIRITLTHVISPNKKTSGQAAGSQQRQDLFVNLMVMVSPKIAPSTSGDAAKVEPVPLVVVNQRMVPNNLSIIASILDNSGHLTATITDAGRVAPSQPIGIPSANAVSKSGKDVVGKRDGNAVMLQATKAKDSPKVGENLVDIKFAAKGKVLDCVKKAIDKFFGCILYVDEFNIAHIRPRYKMLQFEKDPETPPVWGLYGGQPVYPRLFKATWKDKLQITPNAVVVIGESAQSNEAHSILAKANHGLLQGRFGERQVLEDKVNESFNNKFEAYNCAKNKLLSYIRNGYQASVECDIIPRLRPGHRIDIADFVTGMIGGFLIENIQWHYAKHDGMKMVLNLSSQMLTTEDSFTTTAIASETGFDEGFLARNFSSGEKQTGFLETLFRTSNIESMKAASEEQLKVEDEELERQREMYKDRDPLVFDLEEGGRITFRGRKGFDITPPNVTTVTPPQENTPGGKTDGGGGGSSWGNPSSGEADDDF